MKPARRRAGGAFGTIAQDPRAKKAYREERQSTVYQQHIRLQGVELRAHLADARRVFQDRRAPLALEGKLVEHLLARFSKTEQRRNRHGEKQRQDKAAHAPPDRFQHHPRIQPEGGVDPDENYRKQLQERIRRRDAPVSANPRLRR